MFGDEVKPIELAFEWSYPHLTVLRDGHFMGMVSPNGWQGHSINLYYRFGEPYLNNVHLWHNMSLGEMTAIKEAFNRHCSSIRCMICVISELMEEKKFKNFSQTLEYLKEKQIPLYIPTFTVKMAIIHMNAEGISYNPRELQ